MGTDRMIYKPGHYYKRVYDKDNWLIFRMVTLRGIFSISVIVLKDHTDLCSVEKGTVLFLTNVSNWNTEEIEQEDLLWEVL